MRAFLIILMTIILSALLLPVTAHPLPPGADPVPTDEPCPAGLCAENPYTPTPDCDNYPFLCGIVTVTPTNEPCPVGLCDEYPYPESTPVPLPEIITLTEDAYIYDRPGGVRIYELKGPVILQSGTSYRILAIEEGWIGVFLGIDEPVWIER